ncbi:DEAD/DEAH box helicase [Kribbella hippodromi]|uniref:DEAD/DEAH box helicase n=1 Tax=Kribbella hippodromi TaxID=434347 RepID=UPI003CD083CA
MQNALCRAQVAACLGVAAHFSTTTEPAIVAMPTGTGKSAAMSLLPFVLPARRVLLVTPSRLLRAQLAAELSDLQILRRVAAVSACVPPPKSSRSNAGFVPLIPGMT